MVYMMLGTGFEVTEAMVPLVMMRRAGIDVCTVGINGKTVYGSREIGIVADIELGEMDLTNLEGIVLPNTPAGSNCQVLDILDYISNYCLMPIVSIATCILIGWIVKPKYVIDEVCLNGEKFSRAKLYMVMVKIITPILLIFLLLQSLGILNF